MARPRIFVSSTYVDLVGLRETLSAFFEEMGCEPILFERGGIYFDPDKSLDESCYEAARNVDIFVLIIGGRYGSPSSRDRRRARRGRYNSVTRNEYKSALAEDIPIYTFIDTKVLNEFATWRKNKSARASIKFAHVDNQAIFELVESIYTLQHNNLVIPYSSSEDITRQMKTQLAHLLQSAMSEKRRKAHRDIVSLNPYRLFFFRTQKGLSFTQLAGATGIDRDLLRRLELVNEAFDFLTVESFPRCPEDVLLRLEEVLGCRDRLKAGSPDDFLSLYIHYYATYKGTRFRPRPTFTPRNLFPTKIAVFDFDGTLTLRSDDHTTWETIWKALGYSVNECAEYHRQYTSHTITHAEWCRITRDKFREGGLTEERLLEIAGTTPLMPGTKETLVELKNRGLKLYILSGSIKQVIRHTLGDLVECFEDIRANELIFGRDKLLADIRGTRYDFEGKAEYLTQVIRDNRVNALEVLYIGNSSNDIWASRSAAATLCVNPRFTNPDNLKHWTYCIREMDHMREILNYMTGGELDRGPMQLRPASPGAS